MGVRLLRCKRCRQPIIRDARCCPHCAVSRPARSRKIGEALLAVFLGVAITAWLSHTGRVNVAGGAASVSAITAVPWKATQTTFADRLFGAPDTFTAACIERGGTVVQMRGSGAGLVRRCATAFDDSIQRQGASP